MAHLFPWSLELGDGKDPFPFQVAIHFNMKFDRSLYGKFWWWCSPVWASTQFLGIFVFVWNFETAVASCSKIRQNNMNSRFRHVAEAFSNRCSDLRWFEAWEHFAESWLVLECDFDPWKRSWKVTETKELLLSHWSHHQRSNPWCMKAIDQTSLHDGLLLWYSLGSTTNSLAEFLPKKLQVTER